MILTIKLVNLPELLSNCFNFQKPDLSYDEKGQPDSVMPLKDFVKEVMQGFDAGQIQIAPGPSKQIVTPVEDARAQKLDSFPWNYASLTELQKHIFPFHNAWLARVGIIVDPKQSLVAAITTTFQDTCFKNLQMQGQSWDFAHSENVLLKEFLKAYLCMVRMKRRQKVNKRGG